MLYPRSDRELRDAIGPLDRVPVNMRRFFDPDQFAPMPTPGPQDWLANHPEPGQGFAQFVRSHPNRPDTRRHTLYLQPLDEFPATGPPLHELKEFMEAFFSMPVRVLPVLQHSAARVTSRTNPSTGLRQLLTGDILVLLAQRLPAEAFCLLGVTLQDLYPDPSWNFVFGQASLRERVGVYSFARYDPSFYGEHTTDRARLMLRRSCKVLAHETGHMFGIAHCIYFRCLMNGSNHMAESDERPLHLCPVDLHKLYDSIGFDLIARYAHLRDFCRGVGFNDEAHWIDMQLKRADLR
jgi:archaemetzincin